MENALRGAALDWLRAAPHPIAALNLIDEQDVSRASMPWLALAASASTDWGSKDRTGREVRLAFEVNSRGDDPSSDSSLIAAIEARILALPPTQVEFSIASARFLRARAERRPNNIRATLLEFRFRLLAYA